MKKLFSALFFIAVLAAACNESDEIVIGSEVPVIILDDEDGIYQVKSGRELVISPSYEAADHASFRWIRDGRVVGEDSCLVFREEKTGDVFLTLEVTNASGTGKTEEELKVEVLPLELPMISLAGYKEGFVILQGGQLKLVPEVAADSLPAAYVWKVDGEQVSTGRELTFSRTATGEYNLEFFAENMDGRDSISFGIKVCSQQDMPLKWEFMQKEFNISSGRSLCLKPLDIVSNGDVTFVWKLDGKEVQSGKEASYVFTEKKEGKYGLEVMMTNGPARISEKLQVTVCPPEGRYRRAKNAASQSDFNKVYAFLPAPGQFVNDYRNAENGVLEIRTMEEACTYAAGQMKKGSCISLGGFGGYIVAGFDHSIDNSGSYDFAVSGNSFKGSSEPGIIWVMQDENGDGLPNDTWYELKGSETGDAGTMQDYAVTYDRPRGAGLAVPWRDNRGNSGTIDYLGEYHSQDYYYPSWVDKESYTLRGTCLKARNTQGKDGIWDNAAYAWGYADNFSDVDRLDKGNNAKAEASANYFKISDAIGYDGKKVSLKYIDFVKVQTGVNSKSGWLGELSTEVFGFFDKSLKKE